MIEQPIRMQTADPTKVRCKDCLYRDRTTVTLGGKTVMSGVMKSTCLLFDGKKGNMKPTDVLLLNADCPLYEKEG